jgi:PEP-CTERM motif
LQFSLAGFNAATASFTGRFAADNKVDSILLNGFDIGSGGSFKTWTSFTSTGASFLAGLNTLDVVVRNFRQNGGNPSGLRVEFTSSDVSAVPEPASWAMLIAGFGLVGAASRRRRQVLAAA